MLTTYFITSIAKRLGATPILVVLLLTAPTAIIAADDTTTYQIKTIAENLNHPWSLAFLPEGDLLVSTRAGKLLIIDPATGRKKEIANTPSTYVAGQGGYFDVLLDRDFKINNTFYFTYAHGNKKTNATRVAKAKLKQNSLSDFEVILTVADKKHTSVHYGGRLVQLDDGTLLLTTGDGFVFRESAQDPHSQLGKVLRFDSKGDAPDDNPYASGENGNEFVYALGIRSPQGLYYDTKTQQVYLHDHGPKGGDEFNRVLPGKNYGWPATSYGVNYSGAIVSPYTSLPGIEEPLTFWTPSIAPSGLTRYNKDLFPVWKNSFFLGTLVDRDVKRLVLDDGEISLEESLFAELNERIRDVRTGPDGAIYLLTDSSEGRILKVVPQ